MSHNGRLRMSELAERSGVSAGTIKHYLREGLLGEEDAIERTSRNMAYYPPEFVERIALIKRLQEERFMPLRVIKRVIDQDPERARAMVELEDRIVERAAGRAGAGARVAPPRCVAATTCRPTSWTGCAELAVLTPNSRGYDADDVAIIEAIARFRAGGYDEQLGFTVYDTLRYREALEPLVAEEVGDAARAAGRGGRCRTGRGDRRRGGRAPARPDRGGALQAAAGRAAPGARGAVALTTARRGSPSPPTPRPAPGRRGRRR